MVIRSFLYHKKLSNQLPRFPLTTWLTNTSNIVSTNVDAESCMELWWVCVCRSKRVSGTDNSLTWSGILFRVSSFLFNTCCMLLFSDAFSNEALIPTRSLHSEFAATLVVSRPEDAFIDLIANSILEAKMLLTMFKLHFEPYLQPYPQYCSFPCQFFH